MVSTSYRWPGLRITVAVLLALFLAYSFYFLNVAPDLSYNSGHRGFVYSEMKGVKYVFIRANAQSKIPEEEIGTTTVLGRPFVYRISDNTTCCGFAMPDGSFGTSPTYTAFVPSAMVINILIQLFCAAVVLYCALRFWPRNRSTATSSPPVPRTEV